MMRRRIASMTTPIRLSTPATVAHRHDMPASARPMARGSDRAMATAVAATTTASRTMRRRLFNGFRKQLRDGEQPEAALLRLAEDVRQRLHHLAGIRLGIEPAAVVQQDDRAVDDPFDRPVHDRVDAGPIRIVHADGPGNRLAAFAACRAVEPRVAPPERR